MVLTIFPVSLYEDLLPKIVAVLELTQQINGMTNQEAKQNLLQAVMLTSQIFFALFVTTIT